MNVGSFAVYGALRMGSPTCRLVSKLTFLFHAASGLNTYNYGIWVYGGGVLAVHGALYTPTWTRIAASVPVGSTTISLQVCV